MAHDRDNHEDGISRRHALDRMIWIGTGIILWTVTGRHTDVSEPAGAGRSGDRNGADEANDSDHRERYDIALLADRARWRAQGRSRSRRQRC